MLYHLTHRTGTCCQWLCSIPSDKTCSEILHNLPTSSKDLGSCVSFKGNALSIKPHASFQRPQVEKANYIEDFTSSLVQREHRSDGNVSQELMICGYFVHLCDVHLSLSVKNQFPGEAGCKKLEKPVPQPDCTCYLFTLGKVFFTCASVSPILEQSQQPHFSDKHLFSLIPQISHTKHLLWTGMVFLALSVDDLIYSNILLKQLGYHFCLMGDKTEAKAACSSTESHMVWALELWQGVEERTDTQTNVQKSWGQVRCAHSDEWYLLPS